MDLKNKNEEGRSLRFNFGVDTPIKLLSVSADFVNGFQTLRAVPAKLSTDIASELQNLTLSDIPVEESKEEIDL